MRCTRRGLLAAAGAAGLTGCLSGDGATEDAESFVAQVSFPVVHDFAANIVPEGAEAKNLVPVGQHGHGWEPSPDVQRSVTGSDAFVYVFEGFQPWADDMITGLRRDHPDVEVIAAGEGVDMISVDYSHSTEEGHEDEHESDDGHAHGGEHNAEEQENHESEHEDEHSDGHEDEHNHREEENGHENEDGSHDGEGGHDHGDGNVNPHFWLDPLRAKTAVDNVAEGLGAADENEGYTENAEAYKSRLDELHSDFESSLSSASKDTVLVAGHDAFTYLDARYGFRVETLTGIAPDEQPSPQDIRRAQDLIDVEGVEYVLSPVFESDRAAESLVNDTTAKEVLPITAFAGFKQEWLDDGWGYVEVMRNVNLSSLERALEA